jgi:hypothetical protein
MCAFLLPRVLVLLCGNGEFIVSWKQGVHRVKVEEFLLHDTGVNLLYLVYGVGAMANLSGWCSGF